MATSGHREDPGLQGMKSRWVVIVSRNGRVLPDRNPYDAAVVNGADY